MMSKIHNNTLKIPLYGNCRVQNLDGIHIFNCSEKKARWYLKRALAEIIQQDFNATPLIIRLRFIPNGEGHANDNFYLQERQNICVCCGKNEQLTKHHVVPFMYRRFFPNKLKNHTSYDVLPLCYKCHEKYEVFAQQFKTQLAAEYNITKENNSMVINPELKKICLYATALQRQKQIPIDRYNMMINVIRSYYGRDNITEKDLEMAAQIKYNTSRDEFRHEGQSIVERLINIDEINKFIIRWRKHFLAYTQAKYLPNFWIADRILIY